MNKDDYLTIIKFLLFVILVLVVSLIFTVIYSTNNECKVQLYNGKKNYIQPAYTKVDYHYFSDKQAFCIYNVSKVSKAFGSSMQPEVFSGYLEFWKDYNQSIEILKEGMIIGGDDNSNIPSHRISAIYPNRDKVITQGDNNAGGEWVNISDIKYIKLGHIVIDY